MEDRRQDLVTRERWNDLEKKYIQFAHRTYIILALQTVNLLVIALLGWWAIGQNRDRSHDIQNQRRNAIYNNCHDQNLRNKKTIFVLDKRLEILRKERKLNEKQIKDLKINRTFTVLLINALAPSRDCKKLVKEQT